MHAIARAHANTPAISLMTLIVWDIGMKKMKEQRKTSNWIAYHFPLTLPLQGMELQEKETQKDQGTQEICLETT